MRCEAEITAREMQIANLDLLISARYGVAESPKNTCCKLWFTEMRCKYTFFLWITQNSTKFFTKTFPKTPIQMQKMARLFHFKKKITAWNIIKETCPIHTESVKGAFVIILSLNERAVSRLTVGRFLIREVALRSDFLCIFSGRMCYCVLYG